MQVARDPEKRPIAERAQAYVHNGIFEVGGWREALNGLRHRTIPTLFNRSGSLTLGGAVALGLRFLFLAVVALYPIMVRKTIVAPPPATTPATLSDGLAAFVGVVSNPQPIDFILGLLALALTTTPKLFEMWGRRSNIGRHSPYYDLTAAIRTMPIGNNVAVGAATDAIKLTLCALRDEMSQMILDDARGPATEVTLLEFCVQDGTKMRVRARTANHEPVQRPVASEKFVAYYVALEGRNFAEHDFKSKDSPFPATRITVIGAKEVGYRSVLYMPIMCSKKVGPANLKDGNGDVVDRCVGVICVSHPKAYRFWRWGDHKKAEGGFSDVAFARSMPYIALIERLVEGSAHGIKVEGK